MLIRISLVVGLIIVGVAVGGPTHVSVLVLRRRRNEVRVVAIVVHLVQGGLNSIIVRGPDVGRIIILVGMEVLIIGRGLLVAGFCDCRFQT